MGKNYYCEYCDKRFKDDKNIRKKHLDGLNHQIAVKEHYARFKTPKEILETESEKKLCMRFFSGTCMFGVMCRYSHYTPEQMTELQQQALIDEQKRSGPGPKYTKELIDKFMERRKQARKQRIQKHLCEAINYPKFLLDRQHKLPPSLRLYDPKLFVNYYKNKKT